MIKEVKRGYHDIEGDATLQELSQFLIELLRIHPELGSMQICVSAESGCSGALIAYPLTAVVPDGRIDTISLVSNDDAGREPEGWTFYREVGGND
jgi:hypothetical protein